MGGFLACQCATREHVAAPSMRTYSLCIAVLEMAVGNEPEMLLFDRDLHRKQNRRKKRSVILSNVHWIGIQAANGGQQACFERTTHLSVITGRKARSTMRWSIQRYCPCTALQCTALHCTALHCTALHCTPAVSAERQRLCCFFFTLLFKYR